MEGAKTVTWDGCPVDELRDFVVANCGAHKTCIVHAVPQVFMDFAKRTIEVESGYAVDHWQYWISSLAPLDEVGKERAKDGWQLMFPHTHGWDGITMVLYLNEIEGGGELTILDDDVETELMSWSPKPGMAALMRDHAIHGVKAIQGETHRITMIAGAYPYPKRSTKCRCENQDWVRVQN